MLSSDNGLDNCDVQFDDENIRRLSKYLKFMKDLVYKDPVNTKSYPSVNLDIEPLMRAVNTLAIFSAEYEYSFSSMNEIFFEKRSVLTSDHISSLAFINCTEPPINKFNPYIKTWILLEKISADKQHCPKRKKKN